MAGSSIWACRSPRRCRRAGDLLETVATPAGEFHAVLFAALDGEQPELEALDPGQLRAWGAALGRLHAALRRPDAPALPARPTLAERLAAAREAIPADAAAVLAEGVDLAAALAALPTTPDRHGLLHWDFELDNLVWQGETVAMLDFDGCARGPFVADIAFALRDLLDAGRGHADPAVAAFLAGYRDHAPLADADLAALPLFSRLARFLNYAAIARSRDLPPDGDFPDWLTRLDARFAARMATYAASLEGCQAG